MENPGGRGPPNRTNELCITIATTPLQGKKKEQQ